MDQATLVNSDFEIEGKVVSALSRAKIPVTAVDWNWAPQLNGWQLIVVSRWVEERGPRKVYARILEALSHAEVYRSIPIRRLVVKSPDDPVAEQLMQELKRLTEGSIHIVRNGTARDVPEYNLVFAPYIGSGGPIPSRRLIGDGELQVFLEKRLDIPRYLVDQALTELGRKNRATLFNVQMNLRQVKRLKLAA